MSRLDSGSSEAAHTPLPRIRKLSSDAGSAASSLEKSSVRGRDHRVNMSMDSLSRDPQIPANRTFVTDSRSVDRKASIPAWVISDLKMPNRSSLLLVSLTQCHIPKWPRKDVKAKELLKDLRLTGPFSAILLAGVEGDSLARLLLGLVRAAYRTDSVIIDAAGMSGIEQACAKSAVALMGIAAEDAVVYPTRSSNGETSRTLVTPGHTHLITLGNKGDKMQNEDVSAFKSRLLRRLTTGRRTRRELLCVVAGDSPTCLSDIELVSAMQTLGLNGCVLALEATKIGRSICGFLKGSSNSVPQRLVEGIMKGRVFAFPKAGNADHLSSAAYAYLTVHIT